MYIGIGNRRCGLCSLKRGYDLRYLDPYSFFQFGSVQPLHYYAGRAKNVVLVMENLEIRKKCRKRLSNM
jgi:hypothetical protein